MDPDPDPAIYVIDLQDANKKLIFLKQFSVYYFLKSHIHHFSKIKSSKEVSKQQEERFFLLFLLADRRIRIRIHTCDLWIRIREAQKHVDPVDPDPVSHPDLEHWFF
jgi:hypothetical protein